MKINSLLQEGVCGIAHEQAEREVNNGLVMVRKGSFTKVQQRGETGKKGNQAHFLTYWSAKLKYNFSISPRESGHQYMVSSIRQSLEESFSPVISWASLVAQWSRIHLPMGEMQVESLIQEDPTCLGAAQLVCHNC